MYYSSYLGIAYFIIVWGGCYLRQRSKFITLYSYPKYKDIEELKIDKIKRIVKDKNV